MTKYEIIHDLALKAAVIAAENKYKSVIDANEDEVITDIYRVYTKAVKEYNEHGDDEELPIGF